MRKRILASIIVCGFLFCLIPGIVHADGEFMGDLCWSVDDGGEHTITSKVGVFSPGGTHFLLFGTAHHSTDGAYLVNGNAEFVDDKIHMSFVFGDGNNNAMASTHILAVVDPVTFNGTYSGISTGADDAGRSEIRYLSGTLTLIPCE